MNSMLEQKSNFIISVIIPCYKVEHFLDSIYTDISNQTISQNVEYIFVDDGGSDVQCGILDKLSIDDSCVKVVHKKNGGVSSARNVGIEIATGEWIVFVDPDDHLQSDHLEKLYKMVSHHDACIDIGIGGYTQVSEDGCLMAELFYNIDLNNGVSFADASSAYRMCPEMLFVSVWSKIYRRRFLVENAIRFREDLAFNEDTCFNIDAFRKAKSLSFCKDSGYIYVKYSNSSACSSYLPSLKDNNLFRINELCKLQKDLGYTEEENRRFKISQLWILAYMLACNPFKAKTPLSFTEGVRKVKEEIFEDQDVVEAWKCHDRSSDNRMLRLFDHLMSLNSPFVMGLVFRSIFSLKDNMRGVFSKLKTVAQR